MYLADITYRAISILSMVDILIATEDTESATIIALKHRHYHKFNEKRNWISITKFLKEKNIALVMITPFI